jgi:hypothetical protein
VSNLAGHNVRVDGLRENTDFGNKAVHVDSESVNPIKRLMRTNDASVMEERGNSHESGAPSASLDSVTENTPFSRRISCSQLDRSAPQQTTNQKDNNSQRKSIRSAWLQ